MLFRSWELLEIPPVQGWVHPIAVAVQQDEVHQGNALVNRDQGQVETQQECIAWITQTALDGSVDAEVGPTAAPKLQAVEPTKLTGWPP